jgi:hypothetical protein
MRSNTEVLSIFPWYLKAFDVFANTVPRRMPVPRPGSGRIVSEHRLEQILGGAVHDAVTRAVTPEVAIGKASEQLDKLMQV